MKKTLYFLLPLSLSAFAHADDFSFYAGLDANINNTTETKARGVKNQEFENEMGVGNLSGYGGFLGLRANVSDRFQIGADFEYRDFGKIETKRKDVDVNIDSKAKFVNVRARFTHPRNRLYSSFIFGAGKLSEKMSLKKPSDDITILYKDDRTHTAYQFGLEAGYMFENGLDVALGYRYVTSDFTDYEFRIKGITAGVRYTF